MQKEIICTVCPVGCRITVSGEGDRIDSINGFSCKRGENYGRSEFSHPVRILTSTVRIGGASRPLVPVRSNTALAKEKLFDCMKVIRETVVQAPVRRGDVLIRDICGTGADIIASDSVETV